MTAHGQRAVGAGPHAPGAYRPARPCRCGRDRPRPASPRASWRAMAWVMTLTWVLTGLPPQITTRSECSSTSRTSAPRFIAVPAIQPVSDERDADGREPARVLHRVAQPVDAVALHQPHRAGVVVRPHRLAAVLARLGDELLGHDVERVVPRDLGELPGALGADAAQRLHQPVGMVDALGVARDLLADHPGGVVVAHRAAHPADARASSRSTSSAQVLVQSCGQTEGTMVTPDSIFLARAPGAKA